MNGKAWNEVPGGVTAARGFRAACVRAGIKPSRTRDDLVLLVSDAPAAVAATFTTNPNSSPAICT